MHRLFIENYIKQVTKDDIFKFGALNDIELSEEEVNILYHYLNNYWEEILYGNSEDVFLDMEKKFDSAKFLKMKELFSEYFQRYQKFL